MHKRHAAHPNSVLVGIVSLNRQAKLINTLEHCRDRGFPHVVVLDNCSTDGTRDYLAQQTWVSKIFAEENLGGSGGFNAIMRYFIECTDHEWLLLFDDDAYPSFMYDELICFLDRQDELRVPAYALRVEYPEGTLCEMNRPGINILNKNPLGLWGCDFHISEASDECLVDFSSFVGLLLKRETIRTVGLVAKRFFLYSDDTYYTLSISTKVGALKYYPKFKLIHDCKRSSRRLEHHGPMRLEKDIVNKIVLIREYSRFKAMYMTLYLARLIAINPRLSFNILRAAHKGILEDISLYRNEPL